MKHHVTKVAAACYYHLRCLRQTARGLVLAMVISRLDYCNAALADLPQATIAPLQPYRSRRLAWFSSWAPASMSRHICYSCTGYQYAGASSSNCAALCTPSSTGPVQRICQTLLSPSVQVVHVPDYVPHRRRTSHCHGCAQSSTNVHLATPVPLRGTTCLKICAPSQTQRSSDSS